MSSRETQLPVSPRRRGAIALAVVLLALSAAAPGHPAGKAGGGTVSGTVTSMADGQPLGGVEVTLVGSDGAQAAATTTDKRGRFKVKVAAGDYVIALEREGYARFEARLPVTEGAGQVVTVELLEGAAGRRSEAARLFNAGNAALRAGDRAAAKESFLAAAKADPTLPDPHRVLASIYLDEGAWAEAARAAETFLAVPPGDPQVQLTAYEAYRKLGDTSKVVELRRALAADPKIAKTLAVQAFNEGALADRDGDAVIAVERFNEAIELDPELAAARFALATHEYKAERYDEALAILETGLELDPANAPGLRLGFLIQEARGDAEAAAAAMEAYAEVDAAAVAEIFVRRGEADFLNGDGKAARQALATAVEVQPQHAHAHRLLGLAYLTSDAETGKRHLRRFLELAPEDPEAPTVKEILASIE